MTAYFESYKHPLHVSAEEAIDRARAFRDFMRTRRTIREYAPRSIPDGLLELCIETAATAPSGANRQPWHFAIVTDPIVRRRIRDAAEKEEREFYANRAPQAWLDALAPLGTDENKPFLQEAGALIAIFAKNYEVESDGSRSKNYYVQESVGIATGLLIAALHHAGLCTLTHTPSPMGFLNDILERPANERASILLVAGFPASNARVPLITRKSLQEISSRV